MASYAIFTSGMKLALKNKAITESEYRLLGSLLWLSGRSNKNAKLYLDSKSLMTITGVFRKKTIDDACAHFKKIGLIFLDNARGKKRSGVLNLAHPFLNDDPINYQGLFKNDLEKDSIDGNRLQSENDYSQKTPIPNSRKPPIDNQKQRSENAYTNSDQYITEINTDTELCDKTFEPENYDPDLAFFEAQQELGIPVNSQAVSDNAQNAPERKEASGASNVSTLPAVAVSDKNKGGVEGAAVKADEPKKKKERKPRIQQVIPQSAEEVKPYIEKFLKRHEGEDGYKNLDVTYYAGSILDFYLKDDGTWRDNKNNLIHEPYRKVSSWLSHDLQEGKLKQAQPEDERLTDEERDEFLAELSKALDDAKDGTTNTAAPIEATFEFVEEADLLEHKHD